MIQNCLAEYLTKNYTAPSYPLYICMHNSIHSINNKNTMKDAKEEIKMLVEKVGTDGEKFVLTTLLKSINLLEMKDKNLLGSKIQLLSDLLKEYSVSQKFISYFPEVLAAVSKEKTPSLLIQALFTQLNLPITTQVIISLALFLSDRVEYSECGESELIRKLNKLKKQQKASELPDRIIEELLFQLSRQPGLNSKLEEEYTYLSQIAESLHEPVNTKVYNYFKSDWQSFADSVPVLEKTTPYFFKKVDLLRDIGPSATSHIDTLRNIMGEGGPPNEEDIFQCIMMMAEEKSRIDAGMDRFVSEYLYGNKKTFKPEEMKKIIGQDKKVQEHWNIDNFLKYCSNNVPNLRWPNVFNQFDRQKLEFGSEDHFLSVMKIFQQAKKIGPKWKTPENLYFKKWSHPHSQAVFLLELFKCKDLQLLYLHQIQGRRIQKSVKECNNLQKQIWGYLDLIQLMVQVSEFKYLQTREIFDTPLGKYPQIFLLTLSEIRPAKGQPLLDEIYSQVLPHYLQNHNGNMKFLENLWELNQDLMISCIAEVYKNENKKENSFNLSRVLDITQAIRDSLIPFTTWNDYEFSIPLAIIAGKRQFLNFEPWIQDRIEKVGNSFIRAILNYIDEHLIQHLQLNPGNQQFKDTILDKAQLTIELLNKIFYSIMSKVKRENLAFRNFQLMKKMFKECCDFFPEIAENHIPDQIERQTERELNRIYKEDLTIKEAIDRMKKLKESSKQDDKQQFASHITFLCSEIAYHQNYPKKELMITADLFAAIMNQKLIDEKVYKMLLHVIEQDLKQENQKYTFAMRVLQQIKGKLSSQAWFCEKLIDNQLLMKKDPQFVEELIKNTSIKLSSEKTKKINNAIKQKNSPPLPENQLNALPHEENSPIPNVKNIGLNDDVDILTTTDETKRMLLADKEMKINKINTVCNTLSLTNIDDKAKDLQKILDDDKCIKLLAFLLFKRISMSQPNGFQTYYRLMEKIPGLDKPILKITYKVLNRWFSLQGKSVNDNKMSHFKNIGSWLGKMTISQGMPIPLHRLNLKNILISSFKIRNRIHSDVPVIIKILEYLNKHPEIFRSSSPWLSRLLSALHEIEESLKEHQTLKTEIKAFFRSTISIDNFVEVPMEVENGGNNPIITQLDKYIKIDEDLEQAYKSSEIDLKMIITKAVDVSIQEIVDPVIDRAVKIAKVTTKQLILKDFALESDPQKFKESSYNMVKNMAGPLAQVTCREPLKASMKRNLKNLLSEIFSDDEEKVETIIEKVIPHNLDLGCTLIKQAVIESAEDMIKKDPDINESIQLRKKALDNHEQFRDQKYIQQIPHTVPEELCPKPGGLTTEELQIYEEFKKQKKIATPEKVDQRSSLDKINEIILERKSIKLIKEIISVDPTVAEELLSIAYTGLVRQEVEDIELAYFSGICEILGEHLGWKDAWNFFKQRYDLKKKEIHKIVRLLVQKKFFHESCLHELDDTNEEQNKIITIFEKWLDTAHEEIQPYLRSLEQIFNKSQNQIKLFFSISLSYVMQKISQSMVSTNNSYDINYIEAYSKLIIISYKTIASNNCSLYLEHTIQAILEVFTRLMQNPTQDCSYQRPLFKLFTNLICDVNRKQYDIENEKVLTFYCVLAKELKKINPQIHPNFAFAWVEIISNKFFMPALLERYEYWDLYFELFCCLFKFMREYLTEDNLNHPEFGKIYQYFYKGVLKLTTMIIHDFPDFLSEFSLYLTLIPGEHFLQLSNMINSTYPNEMKFDIPQKVEKRQKFEALVKKGGYPKYYKKKFEKEKSKFTQYLQSDFKDSTIKNKLLNETDEFLQTFILYIGWTDENRMSQKQALKKLQEILFQSSQSLREKLVGYCVNLIRYPNYITLFFIDAFEVAIYNQSKDGKVRDCILNSIMKRMNTESPFTWGLTYFTRELQIHKNDLVKLNIPKNILDQL